MMRGYIDLGGEPVTWRGLTSVYTLGERDLMRQLPVREQAIVHLLKSFTPGEIQDCGDAVEKVRPGCGSAVEVRPSPSFIDHEDIPFGETKRGKRPVYALVWTPSRHKICKTKAKATKKSRAWKKWHERNGWKVTSHDTGYFAARGDERKAVTLREYDAVTKERLK